MRNMKLSTKAMTISGGLIWGFAMFLAGLGHLFRPAFGTSFLMAMSSLFPGFHVARTWESILIGVVWGCVDGAIGGFIFAWLYDLVMDRSMHHRVGSA
jgi:hypothetical protein